MARPRQITDDQIDAAARETFVEHGPAAPVALVARKLGVSHAALLQRAGSKDRLLVRALRPRLPEGLTGLDERPPARGQAARLVELLLELHGFHERMLPALMVLRAGGLPTAPPRGEEPPPVRFRRQLAGWLARTGVLAERRCPALADALLGAIEARCFNAYLGGKDASPGEPRRALRDLVAAVVPELDRAQKGSRP